MKRGGKDFFRGQVLVIHGSFFTEESHDHEPYFFWKELGLGNILNTHVMGFSTQKIFTAI